MTLHSDQFVERYPIRVRLVVIGVTLFVVSIFYIFPRFAQGGVGSANKFVDTVETIEIPPTEQMEIPPPPSRPSIPVESDDDDIPEDITIDETELDDFEWDAPPPPPDQGPSIPFIPYDEAPVPIGGQDALMRRVVYPSMAQEAGIEGLVMVHAFINKKGRVTDTMILDGVPNTGLNEAAVAAIIRTRWKPAKQRDKIVAVWISIPIRFKLTK